METEVKKEGNEVARLEVLSCEGWEWGPRISIVHADIWGWLSSGVLLWNPFIFHIARVGLDSYNLIRCWPSQYRPRHQPHEIPRSNWFQNSRNRKIDVNMLHSKFARCQILREARLHQGWILPTTQAIEKRNYRRGWVHYFKQISSIIALYPRHCLSISAKDLSLPGRVVCGNTNSWSASRRLAKWKGHKTSLMHRAYMWVIGFFVSNGREGVSRMA